MDCGSGVRALREFGLQGTPSYNQVTSHGLLYKLFLNPIPNSPVPVSALKLAAMLEHPGCPKQGLGLIITCT